MPTITHTTRGRPPAQRAARHIQLGLLLTLLALLCTGLAAPPAHAAPGTFALSQQWQPGAGQPVTGVLAVTLRHVGGDEPVGAALHALLPAAVALHGAPSVDAGASSPEVQVARGAVSWSGRIAPGGAVTLSIPLRVRGCIGADREASFRAEARRADGSGEVGHSLPLAVSCNDLTIQAIEVRQSLIVTPEGAGAPAQSGDPALVPGQRALIRTSFTNTSAAPVALLAEWARLRFQPEATALAAASELDGERQLFRLGPGESRSFDRPVLWPGDAQALDPNDLGDTRLVSAVTYCLLDERAESCPDPATHPDLSARDLFVIAIRTNDLGDAPDSTNHFGAAMTAYPNTPARYPTVYDPATGQPSGPLHATPRPFHLGQRVSLEAGADVGPDQDPLRNIVPPANNPNNDRADDGLRIGALGLQHCRPGTVEASIFITPAYRAALLASGTTTGYLNLWLDGNRDGDWEDAAQCPSAEGQPPVAPEQIVIDAKIDIAALAGGTNLRTVTTGRVPWPAELRGRPAWLRATLSLEPSTKTLQASEVAYGDGRGHYDAQGQPAPFRSGETEDYLINRGAGAGEADVEVHKWGRIEQRDPSDPQAGRIAWVIEYRNRGDAPAREVVLRDRLDGAQSIIAILIGVRSQPEVAYRQDGDALVFNLGSLAPGAHGRIVITTRVPGSDAPELLRNLVELRAANDVNPANNQAVAELRLELPAPRILTPGDGTTCSPAVTFSGRATPGASVALSDLAGAPIATTTADAAGRWEAQARLAAGRTQVVAVARLAGRTSPPSAVTSIIVDPTLPYDPLSIRFSEQGSDRRHRPVDAEGRSDDGGWIVPLKPNTSYSVSVRSCCEAPNTRLLLTRAGGAEIALSDPDGDGVYTGDFTTGAAGGPTNFLIIVVCGNVRHSSGGSFETLARGRVFDAVTRAPLANAGLLLLECLSAELCLPARHIPNNPQLSDANGSYHFVTPPGRFRLVVTRPGYQPFQSRIIPVLHRSIQLNIALTPLRGEGAAHKVVIDEGGFDTAVLRVRPGALVEVLNVDVWEHAIIAPRDPQSGLPTGSALAADESWESGELAPGTSYTLRFDTAGVYTLGDEANGLNQLTVIVEQEAPGPDGTYTLFLPLTMR